MAQHLVKTKSKSFGCKLLVICGCEVVMTDAPRQSNIQGYKYYVSPNTHGSKVRLPKGNICFEL